MEIKVEVRNEILGNSVFWKGDSKDIYQIPNIPAKLTAQKVVKDGKDRVSGMWYVSVVKE